MLIPSNESLPWWSFLCRVGGYLIKVDGQTRGGGVVLSFTIGYMIGEVKLSAFCYVAGGDFAGSRLKKEKP